MRSMKIALRELHDKTNKPELKELHELVHDAIAEWLNTTNYDTHHTWLVMPV